SSEVPRVLSPIPRLSTMPEESQSKRPLPAPQHPRTARIELLSMESVLDNLHEKCIRFCCARQDRRGKASVRGYSRLPSHPTLRVADGVLAPSIQPTPARALPSLPG